MKSQAKERRLLWLVCGAIFGLGVAHFWPYEPAFASATDRDAKFAICTVEVGPGLPDAVFVLDFSTNRLQGAMLNAQSGQFSNYWFADLAEDFKTKSKGGGAKYAIIPGNGFLNAPAQAGAGGTSAIGLIYVAELSTGQVGAYRFQYHNRMDAAEPSPLVPVASFQFRQGQK